MSPYAGFGTPTPVRCVHANIEDDNALPVIYPLRVSHESTVDVTDSIGVGIEFVAEDFYSSPQLLASIEAYNISPGGYQFGELVFKTLDTESDFAERVRIKHDGTVHLYDGLEVDGTIKMGTANSDTDSKLTLNGALALAPSVTQNYKVQMEVDAATFYINSNMYYSSGWHLYDPDRAPVSIRLSSANSDGHISLYTHNANNTSITEKVRIDANGYVTFNAIPHAAIDTDKFLCSDSGVIKYRTGNELVSDIIPNATPSSTSATGTAGQICWDSNYIYVCTATNTWKRAAIAAW